MKNTHTQIKPNLLRSNEWTWVHPCRMDERRLIQDFLTKHSSCPAGGKRKNSIASSHLCLKTGGFVQKNKIYAFFSGKLKQIFSCKSFDIFQIWLQKTEEKWSGFDWKSSATCFQKKCPRKCVKRVCQTFPERLVVRNIMKVFFIHKEAGSMNEGKFMLSSWVWYLVFGAEMAIQNWIS